MNSHHLIACHECDLMHQLPQLPEGGVVKCSRCGATLYSHKPDSIDRTLALAITGLILFVLSNVYPLLGMKSEGIYMETTLFQGVADLIRLKMWGLSGLVFLTCILIPFIQLLGLLYVMLSLKLNRMPWKISEIFRFLRKIQPWSMMEVFMLGILVSIVKLAKMADIVPGLALYSFAALIFVLAGAIASLDPHMVWERLGKRE
ncbi:MAG: paraquat-inducible protein A [Desulfobacteraceae bacterium]|nr:paraquat-inducible protein A [Desulfobacteraceae bacterium]MBC2757558.1 paraquat-inducible protein A [Desulfobacteraceae bacterium]